MNDITCEEAARAYEAEIKREREIRREQLWIIKDAIKKLVADQIAVKAILHKPHTSETGQYQYALEDNRTKITSLHDMHHEITDEVAHHGSKRRSYYSYKKIRETLFKPQYIPTKGLK